MYHYGGHPDQSEFVYWLDESERPVARIRFQEFSNICRYGDSDGGPLVTYR
jgi:hypothetical protein